MSQRLQRVNTRRRLAVWRSLSTHCSVRRMNMSGPTKAIGSSSSKSAIIHPLEQRGPKHQSGIIMYVALSFQLLAELTLYPGRISGKIQILRQILRHKPPGHLVPQTAPLNRWRGALHLEKGDLLRHRYHHWLPHSRQLRPYGNQKPHQRRNLHPRLQASRLESQLRLPSFWKSNDHRGQNLLVHWRPMERQNLRPPHPRLRRLRPCSLGQQSPRTWL